MPNLIGQCYNSSIPVPDGGGTGGNSGGGTGGGGTTTVVNNAQNEVIPFTNISDVTIAWNAERKAKYGAAGVFYVEMLGEDGIYRQTAVQAVPDSVTNTTQYTFSFGAPSSGRIIIT